MRAALLAALAASGMALVAMAQDDADRLAHGREVYERWCAACHDPGVEHPGTLALAAKYDGARPGSLLEWTDLPAETTTLFVRTGVSVMPFFRKTEISDADLDALGAYLARNTPSAAE